MKRITMRGSSLPGIEGNKNPAVVLLVTVVAVVDTPGISEPVVFGVVTGVVRAVVPVADVRAVDVPVGETAVRVREVREVLVGTVVNVVVTLVKGMVVLFVAGTVVVLVPVGDDVAGGVVV